MVNSEDFIKRLEKILQYYDLSAAVFADKIKVQRSSISHLLSGRNKPSLEFVLKVIKAFPEVNLYWLLNGKLYFTPTTIVRYNKIHPTIDPKIAKEEAPAIKAIKEKTIDKIIIFYSDGSFKSYEE
ncbi:MAG: helix-turn-helix transcriptional regulator [Maribacter sp.]|nr:helix-turn-helix transcriptional regulator [Maribacter sp.]